MILYICQCFIFPSPVFPSFSISLNCIISKDPLNKSNTCSLDKNTICSFIFVHESFKPKKFPTKYPLFQNTISYFIPKFIKELLIAKRNTKISNY